MAAITPWNSIEALPLVLVLDDDPLVAQSVIRSVGPLASVLGMTSLPLAHLIAASDCAWDGVLVDVLFGTVPQPAGLEFLGSLIARDPDLAALAFTAARDGEFARQAFKIGVPLFEKPLEAHQFLALIERAARHRLAVPESAANARRLLRSLIDVRDRHRFTLHETQLLLATMFTRSQKVAMELLAVPRGTATKWSGRVLRAVREGGQCGLEPVVGDLEEIAFAITESLWNPRRSGVGDACCFCAKFRQT